MSDQPNTNQDNNAGFVGITGIGLNELARLVAQEIVSNINPADLMQDEAQESGASNDDPPTLKRALVLDLDGTIRYSKSGKKFISGVEDVAVYADVEAKLWEYRNNGYLILGATNQAGVAFGYRTVDQVVEEIKHMCEHLFKRDPFHGIVGSHSHPNATDPHWRAPSLVRKPHYGMLVILERNALKHGNYWIDWPNSLMVGDRHEDRQCAERAEVPFAWAWDFFNRPPTDEQWNDCIIGIKERREDGWPICPHCGNDELASLSIEPNISVQAAINAGMLCYSCGYSIRSRA